MTSPPTPHAKQWKRPETPPTDIEAVLFCAGLPFAILLVGIRRGALGDRHLSDREQRRVMMGVGVVSIAVSLVVLAVLDAPRALFAPVVGVRAATSICLVITTRWRSRSTLPAPATVSRRWASWSVRGCGCCCPWSAWSRVVLGAHDHRPGHLRWPVGTSAAAGVVVLVLSLRSRPPGPVARSTASNVCPFWWHDGAPMVEVCRGVPGSRFGVGWVSRPDNDAPRQRTRRHCWLDDPDQADDPRPGLALEWVKRNDTWFALVVYVIEQPTGWHAVQTWVSAGRLRPA